MQTQLPYVSSEGGPILIGDFDDLRYWNGNDSTLYTRACLVEEFSVMPIEFNGKNGLVWDFSGPGTAFLLKSGEIEAVFLKYWSDAELPDNSILDLFESGRGRVATASVSVKSGAVLVVWAAEDARRVVPPEAGLGRPKGFAIDGSGYLIQLAVGRYHAVASHYLKGQIEVAALRLRREETT